MRTITGGYSHTRSKMRITQYFEAAFGHQSDGTQIVEESIRTISYDFGNTTHSCCYNGNLAGHGFKCSESDLRRILCADDWEGYPLRKDYVFPREYHGIPASVELDWQQQPDYPK